MRTISTTTISILALGLLAGSTVGVAAQDEPRTVSFSGTVADLGDISDGTRTTTAEGLVETSGIVGLSRWEASDERLSGEVTYTGNWLYDPATNLSIQSAIYELTNDGGSWLGEATAASIDELADTDTVVFTGRDGYEGLTTYALVDWNVQPAEFIGVIFDAQMPPVPEPYAAE